MSIDPLAWTPTAITTLLDDIGLVKLGKDAWGRDRLHVRVTLRRSGLWCGLIGAPSIGERDALAAACAPGFGHLAPLYSAHQ
eukprot:477974-Pyramimonas_sp.AAC.1